jgi:hypothetical protein
MMTTIRHASQTISDSVNGAGGIWMAKYRTDKYWNGYRNLKLTDSQARALETTLAIVLNDPTWPFTNSGEQRALSNALANLHQIMMKREINDVKT